MADRGKAPPRNSSRYLSISAGDEGKESTSVCYVIFYFILQQTAETTAGETCEWILSIVCDAHTPCRGRGQPMRTALLTRMLRAAFTTACCPALRPQLLGDVRGDEEEEVEEVERLAVTREMMASSTRGTTTAFQSRASHLKTHTHTQVEFQNEL